MTMRATAVLVGVMTMACASAPPAQPRPTQPTRASAEPPAPPSPVELEWLRPPQAPRQALAWTRDRDLVLLNGPDGASLWDVASGRARAAFAYTRHAAFSPSSSHFALQLDDDVRVIERATLRLVTTFKPPKRHRLVALLEGPLRVVTQFESTHYAEPGHQDGLQTWRVEGGSLAAQTTCGPIVAVSPEGDKAVAQWFWQGEADDSHKVAQIVAFPACKELASFKVAESDKSEVTAAAFSRDGQHAYVTVGYRDGNGQSITRGLLEWQAGQALRDVATFLPRSDAEIHFQELVVDEAGKRAAFVDVERFVPRTCGSCRYADRSSIGYTQSYEDFLVFDPRGNSVEESFDDARLGVGFLAPRDVEGRPSLSRQAAVFQAPLTAKKPLLVGGAQEPSTLHHLHVGSDWFSFQRGRTFIHVDLAKGSVASATQEADGRLGEPIPSPDGKRVLLQPGNKVELRDLTTPGLPILRVVEGAAGYQPWALDNASFKVRRAQKSCANPAGCPEQYFIVEVGGNERAVSPPGCEPIRASFDYCLTRDGAVHALGSAQPLLQLGQVRYADWSEHALVAVVTTQDGKTWWVDLSQKLRSEISREEGIERSRAFRTSKSLEFPKGLDKDALRTFKGTLLERIQLFGDGDRWTLGRPADGARLTLGFISSSTSQLARTVLVADAGRFFAEPEDIDSLTFALRGEAGAGRLLSGRDVAMSCLDPELLRKLVEGSPLGCVALRPSN
jgi:hypothetical protein